MSILVAGATGFIGTYLVEKLIQKGHFCRCLVRKTSNVEKLKRQDVELFYGDITDINSLRDIAKNIDIVFHLAAMGHVSAISKKAYQRFKDINVQGTKNLATECTKYPIKKFIHFSSTAAMGLIRKPIVDEISQCQPSSPYQKSKYDSEQTIMSFWKEYNLPVVILRPCMVYGPGGKGEFLKICRLIKKGWFPKVGKGKNLTPMVHVDDVIQAAILAQEKAIPGEVYLIASNQSYNLNFIRDLVISNLKVTRPYIYLPATLAKLVAKAMEFIAIALKKTPVVTYKNIDSTITDRVFSINKAKKQLAYCPGIDIRRGIEDTMQWYKSENYI